jgi:lipoate---protein ligase
VRHLDYTFNSPEENLACDDVLLDLCEEGFAQSLLRFWEPKDYFVVLGYSNILDQEVNVRVCNDNSIQVLRRSSGGGTVLQGPGCLNYSLILNTNQFPELESITQTNCYILKRQKQALNHLVGDTIEVQGSSDLTLGKLKFSGNAQRRKRTHLLFHGTFLLKMDLSKMGKYLLFPSKQPDYRADRDHADFLTNLNISSQEIKEAILKQWEAVDKIENFPFQRVGALARERYSIPKWNLGK